MDYRTRRLRSHPILRSLVRETRISVNSLIYPLFIREGQGIVEPIESLAGQFRYSPDTAHQAVQEALDCGVSAFLLFGLPAEKDDQGSGAYCQHGVIQEALRALKAKFGASIYLITDVCLCEYTSHGHCGPIVAQDVDNDASLPLIVQTALSHVAAGADMVAPSGMMDGTVQALRQGLKEAGYDHVPIMSYAAKFASAFYGPFRDAAGSAPQFGDRKTYQMDIHNQKEALKRIELDVEQGADLIIVKPALPCLDILARATQQIYQPLVAYSVSGEYAMVKAAAAAGLINEYQVICESAVSTFRAGANLLITYFAKELAQAIKRGDIG